MKTTKDQAKQAVDTYGNLLQDYAVISPIEKREVRDTMRYFFTIFNVYPYEVECQSIKELALVLTSMWSSYEKARHSLGLGESSDYELTV